MELADDLLPVGHLPYRKACAIPLSERAPTGVLHRPFCKTDCLHILDLPVDRRKAVFFEILVGFTERLTAEKSPVSRQRAGMGRF